MTAAEADKSVCRKRRYRSELDAKIALARVQVDPSRDRVERRAYLCWCRRWHLTSQPKRDAS